MAGMCSNITSNIVQLPGNEALVIKLDWRGNVYQGQYSIKDVYCTSNNVWPAMACFGFSDPNFGHARGRSKTQVPPVAIKLAKEINWEAPGYRKVGFWANSRKRVVFHKRPQRDSNPLPSGYKTNMQKNRRTLLPTPNVPSFVWQYLDRICEGKYLFFERKRSLTGINEVHIFNWNINST